MQRALEAHHAVVQTIEQTVQLHALQREGAQALAAQALLWTGAVVAAALGNYPTPLVGYGSSAVIGYCLSLLAFLPPREQARSGRDGRRDPGPVERADHVLRLALR